MRKKININHNSEFELDLAPLLAVMVKLVPVLLISSAFVQFSVIETDLPQIVKDAIEQQNIKNTENVTVLVNNDNSLTLRYKLENDSNEIAISSVDNQINTEVFHKELYKLKLKSPHIFKLEIAPAENVQFEKIVKVMDSARQISNDEAPIVLKTEGQNLDQKSQFLFPEVVFVNAMED